MPAGLETSKTWFMQNTKPTIYPYHEAWAVEHGYRKKVQAPSNKLQAGSAKRQAPSAKLLNNIIESLLDPGPRISNREACSVALGP